MQEKRGPQEAQIVLQLSYDSSAAIRSMHALVDELLRCTGSRSYSGTDIARILAM